MLHKSWVLFCVGPSFSAVNVLTAPPLLRSVLSKWASYSQAGSTWKHGACFSSSAKLSSARGVSPEDV